MVYYQELMREFHEGICGGDFAPTTTTHKIMRVGFDWTSIFRDSYDTIRKCVSCQQFSGKMKRYAMPLQPITIEQPFSQWGIDVVGPINPKSRKGHMYILITIDDFTKQPESMALKKVDSKELIKFLKDNILLRFSVPDKKKGKGPSEKSAQSPIVTPKTTTSGRNAPMTHPTRKITNGSSSGEGEKNPPPPPPPKKN
jgi:hypothetical protein